MGRFGRPVILLLLIVTGFPGFAQNATGLIDQGIAAYNRGDGATALNYYRQAAQLGDAVAWHNIAGIYATGRGTIQQDLGNAFRYYSVAARLGFDKSQYMLAHFYEHGKGTPPDQVQALMWYLLSANHGNPEAQKQLQALTSLWPENIWKDARQRAQAFVARPLAKMVPELYTNRRNIQPWPVPASGDYNFVYMFTLLDPRHMGDELDLTYAYTITQGDQVNLVSKVDTMRVKNGQPTILALQNLHAGRTPGTYTFRLGLECNNRRWIHQADLIIGGGS